jgi:hypothetical protein
VDDCYVCGLLYRDAHDDDCPRCGRRMRYIPARMTDAAALASNAAELADAYLTARGDQRRERLVALLTWMHEHAPSASEHVHALRGLSLDDLRRDYERLWPP